MNEDRKLTGLETRLCREANLLAKSCPSKITAAALRAECDRRRRSRRRTVTAGLAAGLLVCVAAGGITGILTLQDRRAEDRFAVSAAPNPAVDSVAKAPVEAPSGTRQQPAEAESSVDANLPMAYPVIITVRSNGQRIPVAAGVYYPPRVERVELSELSPAEQNAVRHVLGIDQDYAVNGSF